MTVSEAVVAGRHIRRAGQDFAAGDVVIPAGRRLTARDVGLAAAANHPWVSVHRRPRVAILATGDEIAMPGEPIPTGGIVSSNSHALAALVRAVGGEPIVLPIAKDDDRGDRRRRRPGRRLRSAGDHRRRRRSATTIWSSRRLHTRGLVVDFWQIAMRPGKPLLFGSMGAVPVLGLPGNPVSAMVCVVAVPAAGAGADACGLPGGSAAHGLGRPRRGGRRERPPRRSFARDAVTRTRQGRLVVTPFPVQDSAMLRRLALADALVLRAPNAPALPQGAEVPVIRLDSLGI